MLHLTSVTRVREPGFSRSQCLELAREIDGDHIIIALPRACGKFGCRRDVIRESDVVAAKRTLIVAALREYAE